MSNPHFTSMGRASLGYQAAEDDDCLALAKCSLGYWTDQGSDVGPVFLMITPDLGWANWDAMFVPALNPKLLRFPPEALVLTTKTPQPVKGRYSLVFDCWGTMCELPPGSIGLLGGAGRHLWKLSFGPIQEFELELGPLPPDDDPELRAHSGLL
jgi:hypothetical protein